MWFRIHQTMWTHVKTFLNWWWQHMSSLLAWRSWVWNVLVMIPCLYCSPRNNWRNFYWPSVSCPSCHQWPHWLQVSCTHVTSTTKGVWWHNEYAKEVLTHSLFYLEYKDAIREGDGIRVLRCWKYLLLFFVLQGIQTTLLRHSHCCHNTTTFFRHNLPNS